MFELRSVTPNAWVDVALGDFDSFLVDHACCERKASAVGLSFVVRYPDRTALIEPMIHFAREELEHFHQVYRLMAARGLTLKPDYEDEYVNRLMARVRSGREERFLDRLIVSSVIEARGCERLFLLAQHLKEENLRQFYLRLGRAEKSHQGLFVDIAEKFFPVETVKERLNFFLDLEEESIRLTPLRPAVH